MKVILVDDEQKFIVMLSKRLKFRGVDSTPVMTGEDAIKEVSQAPYDVAVLDIKMPGISGLALKNELVAINPDLKFVFVTGHGAAIDQDKPGYAADDIYLSKPLDIDVLINTIQKLVGNSC